MPKGQTQTTKADRQALIIAWLAAPADVRHPATLHALAQQHGIRPDKAWYRLSEDPNTLRQVFRALGLSAALEAPQQLDALASAGRAGSVSAAKAVLQFALQAAEFGARIEGETAGGSVALHVHLEHVGRTAGELAVALQSLQQAPIEAVPLAVETVDAEAPARAEALNPPAERSADTSIPNSLLPIAQPLALPALSAHEGENERQHAEPQPPTAFVADTVQSALDEGASASAIVAAIARVPTPNDPPATSDTQGGAVGRLVTRAMGAQQLAAGAARRSAPSVVDGDDDDTANAR